MSHSDNCALPTQVVSIPQSHIHTPCRQQFTQEHVIHSNNIFQIVTIAKKHEAIWFELEVDFIRNNENCILKKTNLGKLGEMSDFGWEPLMSRVYLLK